jgi:DNA-binding SARP family transcriptional activator
VCSPCSAVCLACAELRPASNGAAATLTNGGHNGRAVAAQEERVNSRTRLQAAAVVVFSAGLLAAAIVLTAVFGLGLRTTYGSGIDPALGAQVTRDFLAAQDAEAAALSKSDQTLLNNRLSDSALADVIQQIQSQGNASPPTVAFEPASITVLRSQDPNDPSLLIEVQEDGVKTVTASGGANSAPSQSEVSFHGNFWLRRSGDHYTIADQDIQTLPTSYLPQTALVLVALVWVALAYVLYRRTRPISVSQPSGITVSPVRASEPPVDFERVESADPNARTVIRTFGGLQVLEGGEDWAPALSGRQVMAFLWRRVLLAAFEDPAASVSRDAVARQAYPSVEREYQLARLRTVLNQGLTELPAPLRGRIIAEPKVLRFNLDDCAVDALELLKLADDWGRLEAISPQEAATARRVIVATRGTFLSEFESVDNLVTSGRPTCTELIRNLRQRLAERRAQLVAVLGRTYIAGRRPDLAVSLLETAIEDHPSNSTLRELLAEARRASDREADTRSTAVR